ncbi:polysaccharide biosynthesis C-terminal domain-containing protein [Dehalococcoidia bacterium]|nr:polysaccharide biosynthesis C-terminal domain-containing protein [Dehalococcoidia bacterium]
MDIKWQNSHLYRLLTEVVTTVTSRDRLKQLFHIPLYSNAIYLIAASAVNALFGFAFWLIVARFYSPTDIGLASAAISAASLLAMLANLGLGYGLIRFLPHSGKNASSIINSCFSLGSLTSVVLALIFLGGINLWSPALLFIKQNPVYLTAFLLFTLVSTLSILTAETFVAERRAGFVLAKGIIFNLLRLPLVILLAAFFYSFGIFASLTIALGVALLIGISFFLPQAQPGYRPFFAVNRKVVNEMLLFSFANYLSVLFWTAPGLVLPIMVVNLLGAEFNAFFYIGWAIGGVLIMIPTAASASLFAEGSYEQERLGINIWRSLKMILLLLVPLVVLVLTFADKLLLLFGIAYSENATTLVRILAISSLPLAVNIVYLAIKRVEKKLKVIVSLTALAAIVTLGLAYLLLPHMGINGAGIAWLVSQAVIALVIVASWLKKRKATIIKKE